MPSKIPLLLATGSPIIGSVPSTGTAAKAIRESGGGLVVEPESPDALAAAVLELYQNPALGEQLGKKGREFALERYSLEQALDQYEGLFSQIISKRSPISQKKLRSQESVESVVDV